MAAAMAGKMAMVMPTAWQNDILLVGSVPATFEPLTYSRLSMPHDLYAGIGYGYWSFSQENAVTTLLHSSQVVWQAHATGNKGK